MAKRYGVSFLGDENILKLNMLMVAQFWVNCIVYELYPNKAVTINKKANKESTSTSKEICYRLKAHWIPAFIWNSNTNLMQL